MKKIVLVSALMASLIASATAFAGQLLTAGSVTATQCTKLSGDVAVKLSTNVVGGYTCGGSTIAVATCSTAGMTKSRSLSCAVATSGLANTPTTYTASCNAAGVAAGTKYAYTGAVMFKGDSGGGKVTDVPLGTGTAAVCGAPAVETELYRLYNTSS